MNYESSPSRVSTPPPLPKKDINAKPSLATTIPVTPTIPVALPVSHEDSTGSHSDTTEGLVFEPTRDVVGSVKIKGRPFRKKAKKNFSLFFWLISLALFGSIGFGIIWLIQNVKDSIRPEGTNIADTEPANFRLSLPGSGWVANKQNSLGLGANLALSRKNDHMAFGYRDYKQRNPSLAELKDMVISRLTKFLKNGMEQEEKEADGIPLGNQPAGLVLRFEGVNAEGVPVVGECVCLGYRGFGYWLITWCPKEFEDSYNEEWSKIRSGFTFLENRSGWKESEPEKESLALAELPVEVRYVKSIWKPQSPENWDPKAVAVLLGHDPTDTKHAGKAASAQFVLLDAKASLKGASEAALEYFKERQKEEGYPETVISPIINKQSHEKEIPGKLTLAVNKFHVINTEARERYVILATMPSKEKNLVLICDCDYGRISFWDIEFMNLIRSLRQK